MIKVQGNQGFKYMLIFAAFLLLPLMLFLGFWQLDRAKEKAKLIESWGSVEALTILPSKLDLATGEYRSALFKGHFDIKRYFLLDNRTRAGRPGYEVIGLFTLYQGSGNLLVNLGWVSLGQSRAVLPIVELPNGELDISGRIRHVSKNVTLKDTAINEGWPKVVQQLDPSALSEWVGMPIHAYELKLAEPLIDGLDISWPVLKMKPERHVGYAVQWFAMSFGLICMIVWSLKQIKRESYE